jgi:hypothetical protein
MTLSDGMTQQLLVDNAALQLMRTDDLPVWD